MCGGSREFWSVRSGKFTLLVHEEGLKESEFISAGYMKRWQPSALAQADAQRGVAVMVAESERDSHGRENDERTGPRCKAQAQVLAKHSAWAAKCVAKLACIEQRMRKDPPAQTPPALESALSD